MTREVKAAIDRINAFLADCGGWLTEDIRAALRLIVRRMMHDDDIAGSN